MTATITELEREETTSTGEPVHAHIVLVPPDDDAETPQAYVMRARIDGTPVTALCGHTWVPNRMATGLPVCPRCREIYEHDPRGHGDRGDLPDE